MVLVCLSTFSNFVGYKIVTAQQFTDWSKVHTMFCCGEKRDSPTVYDDCAVPTELGTSIIKLIMSFPK